MILDKGLILKGVAGVAAVGGIATTGVALKEGTALNKLLFSSPKAVDEVQSDHQPEAEKVAEDKQDESKTSQNHSTHQGQDTGRSGDTDSQLRTGDGHGAIVSGGHRSSAPTEDDYGIPTKCKTTSPCELTEDELKKIKFEILGDEDTPEVTVEEFPAGDQKLTLTIDSIDTTKKKYIFSNGSSREVKIKKGKDKTITLGAGKTKFTLSSEKLKQFDLDDYGLPKESCNSTCNLTYTDLEDIKFDGLEGTITVNPTSQKVTLTIDSSVSDNKRYTFNNSSNSSITVKGSSNTPTVTLESGKNRFKDNSGKLKKIELDDKGIPSDCNSTCTLTADDLKHVKFPGFEGLNDPVTVEPSNQTISLTINSSKYQFNESSGTAIKIKKGNVTITLTGSTSTVFTEEGGKLVKETSLEILNKKIKTAGFPFVDNCEGGKGDKCCQFKEGEEEIECKLSQDQFKVLKFKEFGGGEVDTDSLSIGNEFKVKIKKIKAEERGNYPTGTDLKFIFDGLNGNSLSIQKKGNSSKTIYLKKNSNTEFILDSSGKLERAWIRQTLGSKVGLSCSGETTVECTVNGPINLITSDSKKYEGMTKSGSGEAKFKVTTSHDYREGYRFKVEEANITLTSSGSGTQTLTTGHCYQAKWDTDNKWWLAHKENSCG